MNSVSQTNAPATGTISDLLHKGTRSDDVVYAETDFDLPPPGGVMVADLKNLQQVSQKVATYLLAAPNDATGKQSPWYPQLQAWKTSLDQFLATPQQSGLFNLIPTMANFVARGMEEAPAPVDSTLGNIDDEMSGMGYYVIKAMAAHITEQQAVVSAPNVANFVRIFAVRGFVEEGAWEDEKMPVNGAGVMILDAPAVVTQLKAGPWQQAKQFLGGAATASGYFTRYVGSGDGLAVLKTKYAANQTAIDAKFSELKTWADAQEQQAGGGN